MIRTSQQQQRPTMFINQMPQGGPMSQQPGQLPQQRMNAPQPGSMQQPVRLMQHPNYANSPQQSNQSSGNINVYFLLFLICRPKSCTDKCFICPYAARTSTTV